MRQNELYACSGAGSCRAEDLKFLWYICFSFRFFWLQFSDFLSNLRLHLMEGSKFHLPVRLKAEEVEEHLRNRRCIIVAFFGKSPLAHRFLLGTLVPLYYHLLFPGLVKVRYWTRCWEGQFSILKLQRKTCLLLRATLTLTEILCSSTWSEHWLFFLEPNFWKDTLLPGVGRIRILSLLNVAKQRNT